MGGTPTDSWKELLAQRGGGAEAGLAGDLVDAEVGGLQQRPGPVDPLP